MEKQGIGYTRKCLGILWVSMRLRALIQKCIIQILQRLLNNNLLKGHTCLGLQLHQVNAFWQSGQVHLFNFWAVEDFRIDPFAIHIEDAQAAEFI